MGHAELQPKDIDATISPLKGAVKRTWADFCATTSIHGFKYIHDDGTNRWIRFIWILIAVVMFTCAIAMVWTFYIDHSRNPTRMNVENDHTPISDIYFPAVTICPAVLFNLEKSTEYIAKLKLPENVSRQDVLNGLSVAYGFISDDEQFATAEVDAMQRVLTLNNLNITEFLHQLRWDCWEMLFRCRFQARIVDCAHLFQTARSSFGHCCSFNINQTGINFTKRSANAGLYDGLSLVLYYDNEIYDQLRFYSHGFTLLLHENSAFPSTHSVSKFVPISEEVFISVSPVEIFPSLPVEALAIEERACVLYDEYPMRFFELYMTGHCELNCRATNMVTTCGCLVYFFDTERTKDRVCTFSDIPCLVDNFADIYGRFRNTQCTCFTLCEQFEYDVQLSSADLQPNIPTVDPFYDGLQKDFSVAHIFISSEVYRRVRRDLLSNTVALVANLGSAFSLFVGMSMVSIVEILYFFTVVLRKYYQQELKARKRLFFERSAKVEVQLE